MTTLPIFLLISGAGLVFLAFQAWTWTSIYPHRAAIVAITFFTIGVALLILFSFLLTNQIGASL